MKIAIGRHAALPLFACWLALWGHALCFAQSPPSANAPTGSDAGSPQAIPQATTQPGVTRLTATPSSSGYTLSPERTALAISYDRAVHQFYWVDFAYSVALLLLFLRFRIATRFRDWAERATDNHFAQAAIFVSALQLTLTILMLPGAAVTHWIQRHFGLSIQSWIAWLADQAKGNLISVIAEIFLVWVLYALIRHSARRWWIYVWLGALPVVLFSEFVNPVLIDPLFFHYTPLAASRPDIARQIERVLVRSGHPIPEDRIYLMNASQKLTELNAGLTGLGASQRVVVWDTTVEHMTVPQIMFVFCHEMGHYELGHFLKEMIFSEALLLIGLWSGFHIFGWALRRYGEAWGLRGPGDWASLPVLLLLLLLFGFVCTPAINAFSRYCEHQADQYGIELLHALDPDASQAAAEAFQILGQENLEEPSPAPLVEWWFYNHPSTASRVRFANTYNPWMKGQSPEFVK